MGLNKSELTKLGAFITILAIGIFAAYFILKEKKPLPIYNPSQLDQKLVDESLQRTSKGHKIGTFSLIDQNGKTVTEKDFEGKIYVADFFFTTCEGICPKMTTQMTVIQNAFKDDDEIKLISHTVTPDIDSVETLKNYAQQFGVIDNKWHLVTGSKKHIYELARKHYFAVLDEGDGGAQDFIHTENFILIDKNKRIRGFYDGTSQQEVKQLIEDIKTLKKEYDS